MILKAAGAYAATRQALPDRYATSEDRYATPVNFEEPLLASGCNAQRPVKEKEMSLAAASSSYPLLNIFWTILEIFLWVLWFWILITVFIDIFRSPDLSGWAKALWFLFVLFIPLIGVLVYLIARGGSMNERSVW